MTAENWRINEYRGRAGLEQLETGWRKLCTAMPNRSRYHSYDAHLAYLDHLCSEPGSARYLALTDGRRMRAICPIEAREKSILGVRVRLWSFPRHSHWQTSDVIAPEDDARRALLPAVINHLRRQNEGRWMLLVGPLPEASNLWEGLRDMGSMKCRAYDSRPCRYFDCTVPYDSLISKVSKHFRGNLRTGRNKLRSFADARFASVSSCDGIEVALDAFMAVEGSGWKGEEGTRSAIGLSPEILAFYRDMATTMHGTEDECEINGLYVGDRCIASQICVRTAGEYAIVKVAYDESYSRIGPGQLLLDYALRRCCADARIRRVDMCSDASWLDVWHTPKTPMKLAYVALGGWSSSLLVGLLSFRSGLARRVVRRLGDRKKA